MSKAFLEILHKYEADKKKQDETREKEMEKQSLYWEASTDKNQSIDTTNKISWVDLVLEFNNELDKYQLTAVHIDFINESLYCTELIKVGDDTMNSKKVRMKHLCLLDAILCVLSNRIPSRQTLNMRTLDHHALFRACLISGKSRANNTFPNRLLRQMLTPELYHAVNDTGLSIEKTILATDPAWLVVLNPLGCLLSEVHYPWATILDLRFFIEQMYFASRGSKVFSAIAQLCDVDFLQGNNTLIWVISDAVSRILNSVLSTSEQIAMQCTPGVNEDQRLMNGPFITYNGGMGTGSSNNENTAIQEIQHATGPTPASVFQPVAFFHNQPAFMLSTQSIGGGGGGAPSAPSIQELQMMGAINPLLTSTVIASDGSYNPTVGNHSNRTQAVNESDAAGFPKLQSIHEFVRDKNLQSDPRVFMSRLATHPFQTASGPGLQPPIPYNQVIQYRPIPQQQQQQANMSIGTMHNGFNSNIGPGGFHIIDPTNHISSSNKPTNLNSSNNISSSSSSSSSYNNNMGSASVSASTSNGNNNSSSTNAANMSQMSKLLKNIPTHLHDIHLMHLKDCKVRKFIPNKAKPEHPSHPLYHQFLEQLLQQRERLLKHSPRKAEESDDCSRRDSSSAVEVVDLSDDASMHRQLSNSDDAIPMPLLPRPPPAPAPAPSTMALLMPQQPLFLSQPPHNTQQVKSRSSARNNHHAASNDPSGENATNIATPASPSALFHRKKYSNFRIYNLETVLKTLENVVADVKKATSRMSKVATDDELNHTVRYKKSDPFPTGMHSDSSNNYDRPKMMHTLRLKNGLEYGEWCSPGSVVGLHPDGIQPVDSKRAMVIFVVTSTSSASSTALEYEPPTTSSTSVEGPKKRVFLCNTGVTVVSIPDQNEVDEFRLGESNDLVYVDSTGSVHLTCDPTIMLQQSLTTEPGSYNNNNNNIKRVFGIALRSTTRFEVDGSVAQCMGVYGVSVFLFSQMDFHTYQDQLCSGMRYSIQDLSALQQEVASMSASLKDQKHTISHQVYNVKELTRKVNQRIKDIQVSKKQRGKSAGTYRDRSSDSAMILSQSIDMEDDLVSIGSLKEGQDSIEDKEEEKYARYMRSGTIVLHDKALSMASQQKKKATYQQHSVRALSFPTSGRSRSHQTIERMTVTLTADQDTVDNMQPVYVTTLEERLSITGGSSRSSTAYPTTRMTTAVELPILEHDIFKKFQQPAEVKSTPPMKPLKRKMPLSFSSLPFAVDADPSNADNNGGSSGTSIVSITAASSPEEQEVAAASQEQDSNPKKKKKSKTHHDFDRPQYKPPEDSGSSSSARDAGHQESGGDLPYSSGKSPRSENLEKARKKRTENSEMLSKARASIKMNNTDTRSDDISVDESSSSRPTLPRRPPPGTEENSYWACPACSLHNRYRSRNCAVCGTKRVLQFWLKVDSPAPVSGKGRGEPDRLPQPSSHDAGTARGSSKSDRGSRSNPSITTTTDTTTTSTTTNAPDASITATSSTASAGQKPHSDSVDRMRSKKSRLTVSEPSSSTSNQIPPPPPSEFALRYDKDTECLSTLYSLLNVHTPDFGELYKVLQSMDPPWTDQLCDRVRFPHLQPKSLRWHTDGCSWRIYLRPYRSINDRDMVFNEDYFYSEYAILRHLRAYYRFDSETDELSFIHYMRRKDRDEGERYLNSTLSNSSSAAETANTTTTTGPSSPTPFSVVSGSRSPLRDATHHRSKSTTTNTTTTTTTTTTTDGVATTRNATDTADRPGQSNNRSGTEDTTTSTNTKARRSSADRSMEFEEQLRAQRTKLRDQGDQMAQQESYVNNSSSSSDSSTTTTTTAVVGGGKSKKSQESNGSKSSSRDPGPEGDIRDHPNKTTTNSKTTTTTAAAATATRSSPITLSPSPIVSGSRSPLRDGTHHRSKSSTTNTTTADGIATTRNATDTADRPGRPNKDSVPRKSVPSNSPAPPSPSPSSSSNFTRDIHASKHPNRHQQGKATHSTSTSSSHKASSSSSSTSTSSSKQQQQQQLERSLQKRSNATVAIRPVQDVVDLTVPPRAKKRKTTELEHLLNSF